MSGWEDGHSSGCCNRSAQPLVADSKAGVCAPSEANGPSKGTRTSRYRRRAGVKRPGTTRVDEILLTVHRYRMVDREIVQRLHFTPRGRSAAQRALTNLWWSGYLDKLPDRPINAPDVYVLSRKAARGLRVVEDIVGTEAAHSRLRRAATVEHSLAVNRISAQFEVAARQNDFIVETSQDELDLAHLAGEHIVPDAFFVLSRVVDGRRLLSGFFLEVELTPVSRQHWRARLEAYADFYYSGRYESVVGLPSLRLLFVAPERSQLRMVAAEAAAARLTVLRMATAEAVRHATDVLYDELWRSSGDDDCTSLFRRSQS